MKNIFELQKKLTSFVGPSGCERERAKFIANEIRPFVDEISADAMGNLIARRRGPGARVMVDAHMDTLGFVAEFIDARGFVKLVGVGGHHPDVFSGKKIKFRGGAVGVLSDEGVREVADKTSGEIAVSDWFADIGARSKKEAERMVSPGEPACFFTGPFERDGMMISSYCDDLLGCAVLIDAIKNADAGKNDMYYVFSSQEEVGCRGALVAAESIRPELAVVLEVVPADDVFSVPENDGMQAAMGRGPVLRARDKMTIYDGELNSALASAAKKAGVSLQVRHSAAGSNNASAIQKFGARVACLSVAVRYVHSSSEMCDLRDAAGMRSIVKALPALALPTGGTKL